jgi:hypothetical protein
MRLKLLRAILLSNDRLDMSDYPGFSDRVPEISSASVHSDTKGKNFILL